jgi:hypothetical protein
MKNVGVTCGLITLVTLGMSMKVSAADIIVPAQADRSQPHWNDDLGTDVTHQPIDFLDQVTSVSQLSDVQPTDWAFQALQSLVERYGCIAGYPDGTFRGNRAATRYELAAALNACLDQISDRFATKEDLATVQALQEEFKTELATLKGRVDGLEARTKTLEAQQFSTTTKLRGEAIFGLASAFGDDRAVRSGAVPSTTGVGDNVTFSYRARLNFETSLTGLDLLRVRLQAANFDSLSAATGTSMSRLAFDSNTNGDFRLDDLFYRFPVGKNTRVWAIANATGTENIADPLNPFLQSDGRGSISRFGRFSPIYRMDGGGPGLGIEHKFGKLLTFSAAYRASKGADATTGGLFGSNYGALAQLVVSPTKNFQIGAHYARHFFDTGSVNVAGSTGSLNAQRPFGNLATVTNSYGAIASWKVSPRFNLSGWAGFTQAEALAGPNKGADADVWNWAVNLAFPDLGKKGNLGGIIIGMPPKATRNDIAANKDTGTTFHVEALYRYQVSSNISITPGVIVLVNPEHNNSNDTVFVGVVRTTFTF